MHIITDSGADIPRDEVGASGITVAPLFIQFPEGEINSNDLTPDEFYDRLEAMAPHVPTTAQPSAGIFAETYRELAANGEEILSIHISSGLSGTVHSARLGAQQLPDVRTTVVDSLTLSGGLRFQVLAAVEAAKAGWSSQAIVEYLARIREATEVVFTLETLSYLARGGRIGRVQALAGSLLRIKPVIHVDKADGKYTTVGKGRTLQQTMALIVDHLEHVFGARTPLWATVMHGRLPTQAAAIGDTLRSRLSIARLETLRVSPVLSVHTGPGIVGVAALPMALWEQLSAG